ncbi:Polyhydroxyalkanoic acid synthase [Rhodovulum sp. PH10]|uniref:class I poly(R)-hydroxyalkanoic acid synthase n=1 Tax=Rhodovulum sp. PH10 TaxID=1187851 RepID=UPI00027C2BA6|nr:class I poly(R)-hydroxyalkanoic acid synthase [Rhodovulum sp. PH10]EJW10564.1 Polyhydroxyalkanoic acid synthase [Rhodovulum sp. PH10]
MTSESAPATAAERRPDEILPEEMSPEETLSDETLPEETLPEHASAEPSPADETLPENEFVVAHAAASADEPGFSADHSPEPLPEPEPATAWAGNGATPPPGAEAMADAEAAADAEAVAEPAPPPGEPRPEPAAAADQVAGEDAAPPDTMVRAEPPLDAPTGAAGHDVAGHETASGEAAKEAAGDAGRETVLAERVAAPIPPIPPMAPAEAVPAATPAEQAAAELKAAQTKGKPSKAEAPKAEAPKAAPAKAEPAKAEAPKREPSEAPAKKAEKAGAAKPAAAAGDGQAETPHVDIEKLATNVARMMEQGGRALAAYLKPREEGKIHDEPPQQVVDVVTTFGKVMDYWLRDTRRTIELQTNIGHAYLDLWSNTMRRMAGEPSPPLVTPDPRDRRFSDPEWTSNQYFDFLKQAYLLTSKLANHMVEDADGLDPITRRKADFYVKQFINALAPSNFVLTNPELLRLTLQSNAENLVRGMKMLAEDIEAGHGELKIRQSDNSQFEVGRNLAITPGKVVYQNELMQLIQYTPTTERVLKLPLLIVPPWINKYYILDLNPQKSFIKYCVDNGVTVFTISWVNPDEHLAKKGFGDYMKQGPLEALEIVSKITGEKNVHTLGYCVGGTMLAVTMAYLSARSTAEQIRSATMFTAQVDFERGGDLKLFTSDEHQIEAIERRMSEIGYLEGEKMAMIFNFLRSNDLVWPYIISNYLKGEQPFPFDLLYWNSDSTRMPAANHSYYLRNCYLDNTLSKGEMEIEGYTLHLEDIAVPIYTVATREDHIAPADSVLVGAQMFGGPVELVVAGSGHIAGIINPPAGKKYQYWTGPRPEGDSAEAWIAKATEHPGSWWPHWLEWLRAFDPSEVPARVPGSHPDFPALEDAPGAYVKVRA